MFARELWKRIETIHAVTYFAPESTAAAKSAGLRGFWMGYFGFRAAPLGPVSAGAVEATFANFEPTMVRRAIPDAWAFATPGDLIEKRAAAASDALRRVAPSAAEVGDVVDDLLRPAIERASSIGRPLFAANRDLERRNDAIERLWQQCTTLREHRGDGHVAALTAAGIDGCQAHILIAADQELPPDVFFDSRGWSDEQRSAATRPLADRGLVDDEGITPAGRELRADIEAKTDARAAEPFDAVSDSDRASLLEALEPIASEIVASDTLPFPNPMGLDRLSG